MQIDTGALKATLTKDGSLRLNVDGSDVVEAPHGFLYFSAHDGREFRAAGAAAETEILVESKGPEEAVVRAEGWYVDAAGQKCGRQITRLHFFRGQPNIKIVHTFVITDDTNKVWFRDIGLQFPLRLKGQVSAVLDKSHQFNAEVFATPLAKGEAASLFQEMYKHHGVETTRGVVGMIRDGKLDVKSETDRVGEWATVRGSAHAVTSVVRDLWQSFPKEIEARPEELRVHLFSNRGGLELDFRASAQVKYWGQWGSLFVKSSEKEPNLAEKPCDAAGLARTHEVWLLFHHGDASVESIARAAHVIQEPILAIADPEWSCATGILGPLSPCNPKTFPREERLVSDYFDWIIAIGERFGHWGFLEHGVVHSQQYVRGDVGGQYLAATKDRKWRSEYFRYGRERYGFIQNAWHLFLRSGGRKYYNVARIMSDHMMDVQMVHWDLPQKRAGFYATGVWKHLHYNTPMFWGASEPDENLQKFGSFNQNVSDYLYPYYITGELRAKDVVTERLDAVKKHWKWEGEGGMMNYEHRATYAELVNLATLYQFSWDTKLIEFLDLLAPWQIDRHSPYGLRHRPMDSWYGMPEISRAIHYLPRKAAWAMRYADMMRSSEDRAAGLKAIRFAYETNQGDFSFAALGENYARYYLATADASVLWRLRELVDEALRMYWDPKQDRFNAVPLEESGRLSPLDRAGSVMATVPYALAALSRAPEAAAAREMIMAREAIEHYAGVATSPLYVKPPPGETTTVEIFAGGDMPWGSGAPLDVSSSRSARPGAVWVDTHSSPVQPGIDPYYHKYYHRATFGPGESAEWYRLIPGYGTAYRAVGPVDLPTVVQIPVEGFVIGKTNYQIPGPGAKWFFFVPKGAKVFDAQSDGPIQIDAPDGSLARSFEEAGEQKTVPVPSGMDGKVWSLHSRGQLTRVKLGGVPPFLAFGSENRFFLPEGWSEKLKPDWPRSEAKGAAYWEGRSESRTDQGLYLGNGVSLDIPLTDSTAMGKGGTIELWFRANFDSESVPDCNIPLIRSADNKSFVLNTNWQRGDRNMYAFMASGHNLNLGISGEGSSLLDRVGMSFVAGRWVHLAVTWNIEAEAYAFQMFIDGKKVRASRLGQWKANLPINFGDHLIIGCQGPQDRLNCEVDEIRMSDVVRYKEDFIPQAGPLTSDPNTVLLFHLDGDTKGTGKAGAPVQGALRPDGRVVAP
ncbi:MAG: hypothetical protein HY360_24910 [Verrucomicrobia bacterium]|nr:hypothetical protein [Verrucomicrobiota bacterium]